MTNNFKVFDSITEEMFNSLFEPAHENMVLIKQATSEGSGEPVQSRQSLRCSHTQTNGPTKNGHLPHWMAAHARLKNEFTEDKKYHNLVSWLIS